MKILTDQAKCFLKFLEGKYRETGKTTFSRLEYGKINGCDSSINELQREGYIKISGNIIDSIELIKERIKQL